MFVEQRRKLCVLGKTDWDFRVRTNGVEAMLRRILQMVSFWCDNVHRVAFCKLKRVVYLGRARPILVYVFYGGYALFITQCAAGGRGFCL